MAAAAQGLNLASTQYQESGIFLSYISTVQSYVQNSVQNSVQSYVQNNLQSYVQNCVQNHTESKTRQQLVVRG